MIKNSANNDGEEIPPPKGGNGKSHRRNGNGKIKTLGPLPPSNLELYVFPDWWRKIFNSLYLKTDGDVINDEKITKQEVDYFLNILNLSLEDRILDLCCGQGRHSFELSRRGFLKIEGLDRSSYLIRKARETVKKDDLKIKFREGDARKLPYQPDTFDKVLILGNSFGYFNNILEDLMVLKEGFKVLKPYGKILIDAANGGYLRENFQRRSWEWIDDHYFVCREREISKDKERLISREIITHIEKGVIADQFYAERLYDEESLSRLLIDAGFSNPESHGTISPDSQRNQDLGMMGNRLIFTAETKKNWTLRTPKKPKPKQDVKNIVVIMGDPHKEDLLKPNNTFDNDDFYTINQLKSALNKIDGYKFSYLENHDNLIKELLKYKTNNNLYFILNLCDEGFNNDPTKEAHIPSILDTLKISYTGAGPQCLIYCYDKSLVRGVAKEMGIPIPEAYFIKAEDSTIATPNNKFPVIVKPNFGDSSFGITQRSVAYNSEQLLNAISEIRQKFGYDKPILIEEFLTGKDLSLGIIGNPPSNYQILPIIEDNYLNLPEGLPPICGYEAKWEPTSPYWEGVKTIIADLPQEIKENIIESSLKLWERLECRDYTRFDWRLDSNGNPKLLEVNPNPGWCWDGHLAKMANFAEIPYHQMLLRIIQAAEQRGNGLYSLQTTKEKVLEYV